MKDVCIIGTGGTIDKEHDPITESLVFAKESYVPQMLIECRVTKNIPHQIIMLKDSNDITDKDREALKAVVLSRNENAIVITHGTSTMAKTAEFLQEHAPNKTIVLTGAMRPFSLFRSDAGFNLGAAIAAAQCLPYGSYIAMNGQIFPAGTVKKDEPNGVFVRIN